jgi:hypothetical protein
MGVLTDVLDAFSNLCQFALFVFRIEEHAQSMRANPFQQLRKIAVIVLKDWDGRHCVTVEHNRKDGAS